MQVYTDSKNTDEIKSVKDILEIMYPEQSLITHHHIFRGQDCFDWELVPSICRLSDFADGKWSWAD